MLVSVELVAGPGGGGQEAGLMMGEDVRVRAWVDTSGFELIGRGMFGVLRST